MKYLPGDKKLREAKIDIAKEWKIDFQKAFGTTHKKLEKLAGDKTKEGMYFSKFQVKVFEKITFQQQTFQCHNTIATLLRTGIL